MTKEGDIHQRHWQAYAAHENTLRAALYSCAAVIISVVAAVTTVVVTW